MIMVFVIYVMSSIKNKRRCTFVIFLESTNWYICTDKENRQNLLLIQFLGHIVTMCPIYKGYD